MFVERVFKGYVSSYPEISEGAFIKILEVEGVHRSSYPPAGSIVPVIRSPYGSSPTLDCREWGLSYRNGLGLTYRLVKDAKLRGIAKFLKERGL